MFGEVQPVELWRVEQELEASRQELRAFDRRARWALLERAQHLRQLRQVAPLRLPAAWRDEACPAVVALRRRRGELRRTGALPFPDEPGRRRLLRRLGASCAHRGRPGYTSPAAERQRQNATCIGALVAAQLYQPRPVVVAVGVDTLELHTKQPVAPALGALLEGLHDAAKHHQRPEPVELGGTLLELQPRTIKGAWHLRNAAGDVVLRVVPDAEPGEACAWVELHAAALWAMGWREAGELGERLLAAVAGVPVADVDAQVTRVDVCADFQGWTPTPEDRDRFVSRAKKRGQYREGHLEPEWDDDAWCAKERRRVVALAKALERAKSPEDTRRLLEALHQPPVERVTAAEYEAGRLAFTGYAFGMGHHLGARLYNKSREIRRSRKTWFHEVWAKAEGYRRPPQDGASGPGQREFFDVWRLEFQLRREALRELVRDEAGGWYDLTAWRDCAKHLDGVWQYLTRYWLRHGWRDKESRCILSRPWKVLRAARLSDAAEVPELARIIPECGTDSVLSALAGYATTAAAHEWSARVTADPECLGPVRDDVPTMDFASQATQVLLAAFDRMEATRGERPEDVCEQKRSALERRKAFLAKRRPSRADHQRARAQTAQRYGRIDGGPLVRWEEADDEAEARRKVRSALELNRAHEENRAAGVPF